MGNNIANNTDRKDANIEELRKRSKEGFLSKLITQVTPIKETVTKSSDDEYNEIVASIFDD